MDGREFVRQTAEHLGIVDPPRLIKWPTEPPLGSLLESLSQEPSFQLERLKDGWHQSGMSRMHPWSTVVKLWLPARVIRWGSTES
jgi:hypothetical protein